MSCKTSKNLKIELYLIEIDNAVSSEWRKNRGDQSLLTQKSLRDWRCVSNFMAFK